VTRENKNVISEVSYPALMKTSNHNIMQHSEFENDLIKLLHKSGNEQLIRKAFATLGAYLDQDIVVWKQGAVFGQISTAPIYHYFRVRKQQCNMRLIFVYLKKDDVYIFIHAFIERDADEDYKKATKVCNARLDEVIDYYNCEREDFLC